jgi:hypothetical protein
MELWNRQKYSIGAFLRDYTTLQATDQDDPEHHRTAKSAHTNRMKKLADALGEPCVQCELLPYIDTQLTWSAAYDGLEKELDGLVGEYPFIPWTEADGQKEFQVKQTIQLMRTRAPKWLDFWITILRNTRTKPARPHLPGLNPEDAENGLPHSHWIVLLTAVTLRTRSKLKANLLITNFSLHLYNCWGKKSVFEFLAKLGVVISLKTIATRLKEIEEASKVW